MRFSHAQKNLSTLSRLQMFIVLHLAASQSRSAADVIASYFQWYFQQVSHTKWYSGRTNIE